MTTLIHSVTFQSPNKTLYSEINTDLNYLQASLQHTRDIWEFHNHRDDLKVA